LGQVEASPEGAGRASRSAIGGAADAAGATYRAAVAAVIAAHALRGWELGALELPRGKAVPLDLRIETDDPLDDLGAALGGGGKATMQLKRSLTLSAKSGSPFARAIDQCRETVQSDDVDPSRDRLAIVTADASDQIIKLAKALERRRQGPIAGAPTTAEANALAVLEELLGDLAPAEHELLLDCLVIWECDAETRGSKDRQIASLLLDGEIVAHGYGERAFETLEAKAHELARQRGAVDAAGLLALLHEHELPPPTAARNVPAARFLARQAAAARYRERCREAGETIRLLGLGADLPPLPLADLDAQVKAAEPGEEDDAIAGKPLGLLVRRRGRLLLTGLPGSGKSTAMRQAAAEQASQPDAPLPLFVDLGQLAKRLESESFPDALISLVCAGAIGAERDALAEEVAAALAAGEATLYLDALDETRGRKRAVVEALGDFLEGRDEQIEVVVATRDSGLVAGRALGFGEARLVRPEAVEETVEVVLRAFAAHRGVADPGIWVKERLAWVTEVLDRDRDLTATPLMPMLLAVSAANHSDAAALPTRRATILAGAVADVVRRWESGRTSDGELRLGAMVGEPAGQALFECFSWEGELIVAEPLPDEREARAAIAARLAKRWRLAPAEAEATAGEAVAFWDEAGFFLREEGNLQPRVKLFGEIAAAIAAVKDPERELRPWVEGLLPDPDNAQVLRLAAGLSPAAAAALIEAAAASGDLAALQSTVAALQEGAEALPELLAVLGDALLAVVGSGGSDAIEAAEELPHLPLDQTRQEEALKRIAAALPGEQAIVAQVVAIAAWGRPRDEHALQLFGAALEIERMPPRKPSRNEEFRKLLFWGVDSSWSEAVAIAAEALVPRSRRYAELAAARMNHVAGNQSTRIQAALLDAGYGELVRAERAKLPGAQRSVAAFQEGMRRGREAELAIFAMIAELEQPRELSMRERRGLDQLVDLYCTLGIPGSTAGESDRLALEAPEQMLALIESAAELGGFELPGLAAEGLLALREAREDEWAAATQLVFIPGTARRLDGWETIDSPEATRERLLDLLGSAPFAATVAARALSLAPRQLGVAAALRSRLAERSAWHLRLASLLLLSLLPTEETLSLAERWLREPAEPASRQAAARAVAVASRTEPRARKLLLEVLGDEDAAVRDEALEALEGVPLDDELRAAVSAAPEGAQHWQCLRCGQGNPGDTRSCQACNLVGPELADHAEALLRA
jgi:hypothetical protein